HFKFLHVLIFVVVAQEIITPFRYKLASILLCWKTNTAAMTTMLEQSDIEEDPNDVVMLESPEDQNKAKSLNSLSFKNKYQSLISVISNMSLHALVGRLCSYIKSIKCMETLEKVWVQSSKPYPISLTLKKLQGILNEDLPMNRDCFNLVVRRNMFDNI
uniref:Uncharacterized protein n=1 Tax=Aegilops tauschii subsp. strangulata TaxID=200361 RepID=A0A453ETG9_AEGTS